MKHYRKPDNSIVVAGDDGKIITNLPAEKDRKPPTAQAEKLDGKPLSETKEVDYLSLHEKVMPSGLPKFQNFSELSAYILAQPVSYYRNFMDDSVWDVDTISTYFEEKKNTYLEAMEYLNDWGYEVAVAPEQDYRYDLMLDDEDEASIYALKSLGRELYYSQALPVFVYGTLRPGARNSDLLEIPSIEKIAYSASIKGIGNYANDAGGAPIAQVDDGTQYRDSKIVGDLVFLKEGAEPNEMRANLDSLEGFQPSNPEEENGYVRSKQIATYLDAQGKTVSTPVWIYLVEMEHPLITRENYIESGDWFDMFKENRPTEESKVRFSSFNSY